MLLRQLFDRASCTYTYLLADEDSLEGVIIDAVVEHNDRDLKLISELGIELKYALETHIHADHISGAKNITAETGANFALSASSNHGRADVLLEDNDILEFGKYRIDALKTPGHTSTCMTYHCHGRLFTGDTILIRGCGRTDFQEGSAETLFKSIHDKIYSYPDDTLIYPGHDYAGRTTSTVGEEKRYNPRLNTQSTMEDFKKFMKNLNLPYPKRMDEAVPANLS